MKTANLDLKLFFTDLSMLIKRDRKHNTEPRGDQRSSSPGKPASIPDILHWSLQETSSSKPFLMLCQESNQKIENASKKKRKHTKMSHVSLVLNLWCIQEDFL